VTHYLYDHEDILATFDETGHEKARYTHGLGIDEPLAAVQPHRTRYYHADMLGSIIALTGTAGHPVRHYHYSAFGIPEDHRWDPQPYRFTGREWDNEIALYYYRARYYSAARGRFISIDPMGKIYPNPPLLPLRMRPYPAGNATGKMNSARLLAPCSGRDTNAYAYVRNSPTKLTDPSGAISECAWEGWKTFGLCALGTFIAIDMPLAIGVAGCMTLGPGALPCAAAVLGVFEHVEIIALTACAAAGVSTYLDCERKEEPCAQKR
jgi:RHS repeat-associated protein